MPQSEPSSVVSALRSLGVINGLTYLAGRLLQKFSGGRCRIIRYYLVAQPIPDNPQPLCKPSESDLVSTVSVSDAVVGSFPRPAEVIASRFARQHTCLVATSKGRFSGFLWYALEHYEEDEVCCLFDLDPKANGVWDYDVHVEPQFRLGRTFARLWDEANRRLSEQGFRWSFSRISAFNVQSLQSHKKLGLKVLSSLTFFCFGPLQIMVSSCAPYINMSWKRIGRPVVRVHAKI